MYRFFLLLLVFIPASCQTLHTHMPKGTMSDESILELKLDYRSISTYKVIGTVQNNSKNRVYDVRVRIEIIHADQSTAVEHFVIPRINPYENYKFKKSTEDMLGTELRLQIQSSHY
ncbi:hypothetical protein [Fluviicola sp.]|uniref:hypothetical protein n=1 Tax=Fluviicola sp. TaxID=1917219 RepID=UPI0031DB038B